MRHKGAIAVIVLAAAIGVGAVALPLSEVLGLLPAGESSACSTVTFSQLPHWPATHQGFSYASEMAAEAEPTSTLRSPTDRNPQSKLWYNDGAWWAVVLDDTGESVRIHERLGFEIWRKTGTVVDERPDSTADVLWDGTKLFVASGHLDEPIRILRFSYDSEAREYDLDTGFPVTIDAVGSSSAVIEKDSTGRLWVAYVRSRSVWVTHSTSDQVTWEPPFVPPVPGTDTRSEDVAALVAFDGRIGLMWSNQASDTFQFAVHEDGAPTDEWSVETALSGPGLADNHINLKSDSTGRVYAAVKTSQGADVRSGALTLLLVREPDGSWQDHLFGTRADRHTRPIVVIDEASQVIHMFATRGAAIIYKRSPISEISFPAGPGAPFIEWPGASLNNVTAGKHPVDARTGLVVLASSPDDLRYYHASLAIRSESDRQAPTPEPAAGPISFRDASTAAGIGSSELALDLPLNALPGDLLVASVDAADAPDIAAPLGWNLVRDDRSGSALRQATYWRVVEEAEPASYTWQFSSAVSAAGVMLAYGGVDPDRPIETTTGRAGDESEEIAASSAKVGTSGPTLVALFGMAALTDIDLPGQMATRAEASTDHGLTPSSDDGHPPVTIVSGDVLCPRSGASGEVTAAAAQQGPSIGQLLMLRPASRSSQATPATPGRSSEAPQVTPSSRPASPLPRSPAPPTPGEITFRSASVGAHAGEVYLRIDMPEGVQPGDLLLASIDARGTPEIVAPFGWRLVRVEESGTTMRKATFFRVVGSNEPANYIWYLTKEQPASGIILAYAGVDPVYPIESSNGFADEVTSKDVRAASINVGTPDSLLVGLFSVGTFAEVSAPPGMRLRAEISTPEERYRITSIASDRRQSEPGITGDQTATSDRSAKGIGQLIVLRPAE